MTSIKVKAPMLGHAMDLSLPYTVALSRTDGAVYHLSTQDSRSAFTQAERLIRFARAILVRE